MQSEALIDESRRGQELRYVTAHLRDLQGLRMAPYWTALLVLSCMESFGAFRKWPLGFAALAFTVAQFGWLYLRGRWYERRYGVVKNPELGVRSGLISIMNPEKQPPHHRIMDNGMGKQRFYFLCGQ